MQSQLLVPLPQDAVRIAEMFYDMDLLDRHECAGGECWFYLAKRKHGSYFFLIFSDRLHEGQLLLETDTETPAQAFVRRIEQWRHSHYCNGCQLCTAKGGANGSSEPEPVVQTALLVHSA